MEIKKKQAEQKEEESKEPRTMHDEFPKRAREGKQEGTDHSTHH